MNAPLRNNTRPTGRRVRAAAAAGLALLMLAAPAAAELDARFQFDNGLMRFGYVDLYDVYEGDGAPKPVVALEESVNVGGTLNAPYYFNADDDRWYQLTFSERSLDFAVGVGRCEGDLIAPPTNQPDFHSLPVGECFWHRNLALASSNGNDSFPYYNAGTDSSSGPSTRGGLESFTRTSTVVDGTGVITVSGEFTLTPPSAADYSRFADFQDQYRFRVEHRYELRPGEKFLRVQTTLTNLTTGPSATAENVNIWVGTRDDYLGNSDSMRKERGVIAGGTFTRLAAATDPSNAIRVSTEFESILFFSTSAGVNTVFSRFGNIDRTIIPVPPSSSGSNRGDCTEDGVLDAIACHDKNFDGSYAIVLPAGDMAPGGVRTINWFYAAGAAGDIDGIIANVADVAEQLDEPTTPTTNGPSSEQVAVDTAIEQSAPLTGIQSLLIRRGDVVPLQSRIAPSGLGPRNEVVLTDEDGTLSVRLTATGGVTERDGVIVPENGEIVCEICALLAAGTTIEAWIYSEPRLAAAVRVPLDYDPATFVCPFLRIPVGTPLDGGSPIPPGVHTLQLRMTTQDGYQVLSTGITIGTPQPTAAPIPSGVPTGGGPKPSTILLAMTGLLGLAYGIRTSLRTITIG